MKRISFATQSFKLGRVKQTFAGFVLALTVALSPQVLMAAGPAPLNLGSTASFAILSGAAVTSTGGGIINGNVGASPIAGSAIGLNQAQVNGTIYTVDASGPAGSVEDPTLLTTAKGDLTTAYNDAAGRTPVPTGPFLNPNGGNIGGLNLVPGLYKFTGTALITGASVTLTGGPNDVWIFQIAADLEVGSSIQVILAGGAQAGNVFWQVGTSATIGTFAVFNGSILASQSITMDTSSTMNGRALAFSGGVTYNGVGATLPIPENAVQGSLQVNLAPPNAVIAGAQWQVDGGSNQDSGVTLTNLSPGSHIVSFKPVAGWITPSNQIAIITNSETTTNNGLYALTGTAPSGSLTVTILPAGAVTANAQWQVDGSAQEISGATVDDLSPGSHVVSFIPIAGWLTPSNQTIMVTNAETTAASGLYVLIGPGLFGSLTVTILPAGAVSAGAQWQLDSGTNEDSGETTTNLAPGSYEVSFTPTFGWVTPADQQVIITNGAVTTASGLYAVTNSFIAASGIYNGLFSQTNGVAEQTAGMLKNLSVRTNGAFSGTVLINGSQHLIRGDFDANGKITNTISRPASQGGNLMLAMPLDASPRLPLRGTVSGMLDGTPWAANLIADLAHDTLPAAEYTMLLPPDTNNQPPISSPGGDSYFLITNYTGTVKNPALATIRITGALADGTAFSQTVPVSRDGYVPIYDSLYAGKGLLLGWINLTLTNTVGVGLAWIHPERAFGIYKLGFTNVVLTNQILISEWTDPSPNAGLLTGLSLRSTIDDPLILTNYLLTLSRNFSFADTSASPLVSGSINPKTGYFKVIISIRGAPMTAAGGAAVKGNEAPASGINGSLGGPPLEVIRLTAYGAILQNATNGGGYFLTTTNGQAVQLNP